MTQRTKKSRNKSTEKCYLDRGEVHLKYLILGTWAEYFEGIRCNVA